MAGCTTAGDAGVFDASVDMAPKAMAVGVANAPWSLTQLAELLN